LQIIAKRVARKGCFILPHSYSVPGAAECLEPEGLSKSAGIEENMGVLELDVGRATARAVFAGKNTSKLEEEESFRGPGKESA